MIGPRRQKQEDKLLCSGCECKVKEKVKTVHGAFRFKNSYLSLYWCIHPDLEEKAIIETYPLTPDGCPAIRTKSNKSLNPTSEASAGEGER